MSLMDEIRHYPVARGTAALWWLGQNGFLFKTSEGTVVATDLYLSNSCAALAPPGMDLSRQVPVLIPPEEIDVDIYVCTHSHTDHADPETIARLRHKDTMRFVGPHQACDVFRQCGVESGRIETMWPDHVIEAADVTIRATFAMPTDDTDLNHVGYIFSPGRGPRIYMTGDTAACELLGAAWRHEPQFMITCINGGFRNLSHDQAALLAAEIRPRVAIPCHYDMFPDNSIDPRLFRAMLKLRAPDVGYAAPRHGEAVVLER
jgi:L-ascorbate 6-phosphate lactonase